MAGLLLTAHFHYFSIESKLYDSAACLLIVLLSSLRYFYSCEDLVDGFQCNCFDGYEGDSCDRDVNECVSQPCLNGGICLNAVATFQCNCPSGFSGTLAYLHHDLELCSLVKFYIHKFVFR